MNKIRIQHHQPPESLIQALASRDAVLWVGNDINDSNESIEALQTLIKLQWKLVLSEVGSKNLLGPLEASESIPGPLNRKRGFLHIIASNPEGIQIPPRALPIFLLNGREDPHDAGEAQRSGSFGGMRRRLNMLNELVTARPRVIVLVSNGSAQPLEDFFVLWKQENFRCLIVLISTADNDANKIDSWLSEPSAAAAVDHWQSPLPDAVQSLTQQLKIDFPEERIVIRIRNEIGTREDLDVTDCESIERPLLEGYELVQSKDVRLMQPLELARDDFVAFFDKSSVSWRPFAAGLPWRRNWEARRHVLDALKSLVQSGPTESRILSIISESGAGGTTFARMLAFEAALEGYPTLVARSGLSDPHVIEISSFMYRVHVAALEKKHKDKSVEDNVGIRDFETPWLIVFDVNHWDGRDAELRSFLAGLTKDGRPSIILAVSTPFTPADLSRNGRVKQIASLTHELSLQEALQLGGHLNKFLTPFNKAKTNFEWQQFWENHRPDYISNSFPYFWIALEFWLKGQFDMNESIQVWLYRSFKEADIADDVRQIVLEIAALSIERQPLPEGLLPTSAINGRSYSWLLEDVRAHVPALALVRDQSNGQKVWVMAHDLLGRYLLTSLFYDRAFLKHLDLTQATDPIDLRLLLLRRVACRSAIGLKEHRSLALNFAIKILKLDTTGNQEFVTNWREVLSILDAMPANLRQTSRTFNHHVAISLRRVVKQTAFGATAVERGTLLRRAVEYLEYALNELDASSDDETNLNLFNSLALAYQDLADVERDAGIPQEIIDSYRLKATEATRSAFKEDPTNSYAIETMAKNLIQEAENHPQVGAASAAEALGFIYQAVTLERSEFRQSELTRLANRALKVLRLPIAQNQVIQLARSGNPLGTLAEAWMLLTDNVHDLNEYDLTQLPSQNVSNAIAVLESTPDKSNWMLLRFRYDLVIANRPYDFKSQVMLLDEIAGTNYRMPLQLRLEYAILLHQQNRSTEGNKEYRRLRQDLKQFDSVVEVPQRLNWLKSSPEGGRKICDAQVVEHRGHRSSAKVSDLKNEIVPFIPQEFGVNIMPAGAKFKCLVSFGRMGPFLKPPQLDGQS